MSKYHKGDKFIVEIKEVINSDNGTLYRSDFKTLTFDDYGLDALQKCETELSWDECYSKGLNDGYELGKKLWVAEIKGGLNTRIVEEIFDCDIYDVYTKYTPQEALAKLEEYEKEQAKIKVGDVVEHNGNLVFVVTRIDRMIKGYDKEGNTHSFCFPNQFIRKTGKHIDIQSVLEQIGE